MAREAHPQAGAAAWRQYAAQLSEPAGAGSPRAVQQAFQRAHQEVVRQARLVGSDGRSEFTVRLHPPELGRMRVEIEMQAGKLDVRIKVENPQLREALRAELENLDRALRGAQMVPSRLEIMDYQTGRQGGWEGPANDRPEAAPAGGVAGSPDVEGRMRPAEWALFTESGGIDCLV